MLMGRRLSLGAVMFVYIDSSSVIVRWRRSCVSSSRMVFEDDLGIQMTLPPIRFSLSRPGTHSLAMVTNVGFDATRYARIDGTCGLRSEWQAKQGCGEIDVAAVVRHGHGVAEE